MKVCSILPLFLTIWLMTGCLNEKQNENAVYDQVHASSVSSGIPDNNNNDQNQSSPMTSTDPALSPTYILESDYEGDEKGIVQTINLYMKAFHERNFDLFYSLLSKDNDWKIHEFKKTILRVDNLNFNVKPSPPKTKDIKSVVIQYKVKYDEYEGIEQDEQLFSFRLEDKKWKLVSIEDYWT